MIRTYNPENAVLVTSWVSAITGAVNSKQILNWESITFNYTDDRYDFTTSTTGQITRSKIMNKLGTAVIESPEGSDVSEILSKLINSNSKLTIALTEKTPTVGDPATVVEYTLSEGSISNPGDGVRSRTAGMRSWTITGEVTKLTETDYVD